VATVTFLFPLRRQPLSVLVDPDFPSPFFRASLFYEPTQANRRGRHAVKTRDLLPPPLPETELRHPLSFPLARNFLFSFFTRVRAPNSNVRDVSWMMPLYFFCSFSFPHCTEQLASSFSETSFLADPPPGFFFSQRRFFFLFPWKRFFFFESFLPGDIFCVVERDDHLLRPNHFKVRLPSFPIALNPLSMVRM